MLVIRITSLLTRACKSRVEGAVVHVFDSTLSTENASFLSGISVNMPTAGDQTPTFEVLQEREYSQVVAPNFRYEEVIQVESRNWTVVVTNLTGSFRPDLIRLSSWASLSFFSLASWSLSG